MTEHKIGEQSDYEGNPVAISVIMRDKVTDDGETTLYEAELWDALHDLVVANGSSDTDRSPDTQFIERHSRQGLKSVHIKIPDPVLGDDLLTQHVADIFENLSEVRGLNCPISVTVHGAGDRVVMSAHRFSTLNVSVEEGSLERNVNYILPLGALS